MRLIDADELLAKWKKDCTGGECLGDCFDCQFPTAIEELEDAPTIDAVEVVHGEWKYNPKDAIEMMFTLPKCSICGHESSDALNYCPNCGAKMEVQDGQ